MRLNEETMQERRDQIVETAFRLFCEQGIEPVTISQVAEQSGVGERTMYRYFTSKKDLVGKVLIHRWELLIDGINSELESCQNYQSLSGYEQLALWLNSFRQFYDNIELILFSYEVKIRLLRNRVQIDRGEQEALTRGIRGPCIAALEKGKADGSLTFSHSSEEIYYTLWGCIRGCIGEDSFSKNSYEIMVESFLRALRGENR